MFCRSISNYNILQSINSGARLYRYVYSRLLEQLRKIKLTRKTWETVTNIYYRVRQNNWDRFKIALAEKGDIFCQYYHCICFNLYFIDCKSIISINLCHCRNFPNPRKSRVTSISLFIFYGMWKSSNCGTFCLENAILVIENVKISKVMKRIVKSITNWTKFRNFDEKICLKIDNKGH